MSQVRWTQRATQDLLDIGDFIETYLRSYRILYRAMAGEIVVLTVFEGHHRIPVVDPDDEPSD